MPDPSGLSLRRQRPPSNRARRRIITRFSVGLYLTFGDELPLTFMFRPSKGLLTRGHPKGIPPDEPLPSKVTTLVHCDVHSSKFKPAVEAYTVLSDRRRRERYDMGEDEDGRNNPGMPQMGGPPGGTNLADIFAQFQGGGGLFGGGRAFGF